MTPKINHTLLTREQETALLQRAQAGDAAARRVLLQMCLGQIARWLFGAQTATFRVS